MKLLLLLFYTVQNIYLYFLYLFISASRVINTPPEIDLEKVTNMNPTELANLVRHYANENEALRRENAELFSTRDLLIRDQELVCKENERLLKKLEDVNS